MGADKNGIASIKEKQWQLYTQKLCNSSKLFKKPKKSIAFRVNLVLNNNVIKLLLVLLSDFTE